MKKICLAFCFLLVAFCLYFSGHAYAYIKGELLTVIYGEEETSGSFNQPQSIYVDQSKGKIYIIDTLNNRIISYDRNYKFISQFSAEGKLNLPVSMLKDKKGHLILTNKGEGSVLIIYLKEKIIKPLDFSKVFPRPVPSYLAMDKNGRLYVIDEAYKRILIFSDDYKFLGEIKEPQAAGFSDIKCVENRIYALDTLLKKVFVYDYQGHLTCSLEFKSLSFPVSLAVDKSGYLYILDAHEGKVYLFKDHEIIGEIGKKGWKEGKLYYPGHISIDNKNTLYVVDTGNNRIEVFKIK
ncbi:MAG: NHL repeat-containing protein [Deltaproteobacteria bacterium]|nr:NHL repeat-containing protein [Deltaproteobacteria bacterium]MBW1937362.1 NHL repeat-containing protein [Deltaproteobacteria bacterium]MBW1964214.1 NHL repeat-containing protein [Deltaproteobacteria bacterium]MBW2350074.1 NHL repeat-containing protein [Deltaproteobacteria bacterium]